MDDYAHSTDIQVQLRDIDEGRHVNNAVFVAHLEQARLEYLDELVGYFEDETYIVVVSLDMTFESPVRWGDTLTIDVRIPDLGEKSFEVDYRLRVGERVAATAHTTMVTYDREAERAIPVPPTWRDRIEADTAGLEDGADDRPPG